MPAIEPRMELCMFVDVGHRAEDLTAVNVEGPQWVQNTNIVRTELRPG